MNLELPQINRWDTVYAVFTCVCGVRTYAPAVVDLSSTLGSHRCPSCGFTGGLSRPEKSA